MSSTIPEDGSDGLAELAKLYRIILRLFDELKDKVDRRWSSASKMSFNERMGAIEHLRTEYEIISEARRRGVNKVVEKANFKVERSKRGGYVKHEKDGHSEESE